MRKVVLVLFLGLALAQPTHTVAPGDTLFSIARRYGTTVEELMRLNRLESFLIQVGQVLRLPEKAQGERVHQVVPGDTLWTYAASTCTSNRGLKSRLSLPAMSLRRHW
jgi:LysM repeat protein